jgi:hypothetical protein
MDKDELVSGQKYGFYYGGIPMVGIHTPGKGNETRYPTFSVDGTLYSVNRNEVATKVVSDA